MIGTLVGMVQMFANMTDPSKLGPFMATALLATLYGAVVANMLCLPIADKLHLKLVDEEINRTLDHRRHADDPRIRRARPWCAKCCSPICPKSIGMRSRNLSRLRPDGIGASEHKPWRGARKLMAAATAGSSPSPISWACW